MVTAEENPEKAQGPDVPRASRVLGPGLIHWSPGQPLPPGQLGAALATVFGHLLAMETGLRHGLYSETESRYVAPGCP